MTDTMIDAILQVFTVGMVIGIILVSVLMVRDALHNRKITRGSRDSAR